MKFAAGLIVLLVAAILFLPIPMPGDTGSYNQISGLIWCANDAACTHENGHALDQSLGWPSQSETFAFDVQVYVIEQMHSDHPGAIAGVILDAWMHPVTRLGTNPNAELYAQIYQAAGGDVSQVPVSLQQYYGGK